MLPAPFERSVSIVTSGLVILAAVLAGFALSPLQKTLLYLKLHLWLAAFLLIALSQVMATAGLLEPKGSAGIAFEDLTGLLQVLWAELIFCTALTDLLGSAASWRIFSAILAIGMVFWLSGLFGPVYTTLVALYQLVMMTCSFVIYSWLASRLELEGAGWLAFAVVWFAVAVVMLSFRRLRTDESLPVDTAFIANIQCVIGMVTATIGLRHSLASPARITRLGTGE